MRWSGSEVKQGLMRRRYSGGLRRETKVGRRWNCSRTEAIFMRRFIASFTTRHSHRASAIHDVPGSRVRCGECLRIINVVDIGFRRGLSLAEVICI